MSELAEAFMDPDPVEAMRQFIACFGRFWAVDPLVMRRLRALAALDPEVGAVIAARDARRREGLEVLVGRRGQEVVGSAEPERVVRVLYALTSFETFAALAGPEWELSGVVDEVVRIAWRVLGVSTPRQYRVIDHPGHSRLSRPMARPRPSPFALRTLTTGAPWANRVGAGTTSAHESSL
jgi:hypothetical protein